MLNTIIGLVLAQLAELNDAEKALMRIKIFAIVNIILVVIFLSIIFYFIIRGLLAYSKSDQAKMKKMFVKAGIFLISFLAIWTILSLIPALLMT